MKNSKSLYIIIGIIFVVIIGLIIYFYVSSNNNNNSLSDYSITKTLAKKEPIKEIEISSFSTEILDDSEGRLKNIKITCDILNDTIVEPKKEFSFNNIVGQPSSDRGYQEAAIIVNHEKEQGIGRWKLPSKQHFI